MNVWFADLITTGVLGVSLVVLRLIMVWEKNSRSPWKPKLTEPET